MMLNVLWLPAFVSVSPVLLWDSDRRTSSTNAGSDSVGVTQSLATLNIWGASFQNVMYQPWENVTWNLLLKTNFYLVFKSGKMLHMNSKFSLLKVWLCWFNIPYIKLHYITFPLSNKPIQHILYIVYTVYKDRYTVCRY